jgi:hypothetical protein
VHRHGQPVSGEYVDLQRKQQTDRVQCRTQGSLQQPVSGQRPRPTVGPAARPARRRPRSTGRLGTLRQPDRACSRRWERATPGRRPIGRGHRRARCGAGKRGQSPRRAGSGMRAGHGRKQARGRPRCSAGPWPACRPVLSAAACDRVRVRPTGRLRRCPGVRGCWRSCDGVRSAGVSRGHCGQGMSAATGSGRLTSVRWWGAATAARPAGAAGQAAGGAARAHRSWPAAPAPGPPRRSARQAGGPAGRRAPSRR